MTPVPELFREAVVALQSVRPRREVLLEPMRAPQRLAPWSYAVSCEVAGPADVLASGRLVLLHDPEGQEGWDGVLRLVMYVRAPVSGGRLCHSSSAGDARCCRRRRTSRPSPYWVVT